MLDDAGLAYVCTSSERFCAVASVLGQMVEELVEQPSPRLLKYIIRCYLRLTDDRRFILCAICKFRSCEVILMLSLFFARLCRACNALRNSLPTALRDGTFNDLIEVISLFWCQKN